MGPFLSVSSCCSGLCCGRNSRSQADRPCSIPIFLGSVSMTHGLSDPLSSPSDQSRLRVLNQLSPGAQQSCCIPAPAADLALCFWLCPLWGQKPAKPPFLIRLHLSRTEETSCSGESEGLSIRVSSPLHFSCNSLSVPSPYQLTQHLYLSAKQKCRSIRGKKKNKIPNPSARLP